MTRRITDSKNTVKIKRLPLLDELRGLAVFCMMFYHSFYLADAVFSMSAGRWLFDFFTPAQPFFAALFIAISGISSYLSHSNLRRGLKLLAVALGISLLTCLIMPAIGFEGFEIRFGILHLLSVSMLIFEALRPLLDRMDSRVGAAVFFALYFLTRGVSSGWLGLSESLSIELPRTLYNVGFLFPLGFYPPGFHSADYFPVLPNTLLFISASFIGRELTRRELPEKIYRRHVPFFSFLGRHALPAYVLHYPAALAVLYIISIIV